MSDTLFCQKVFNNLSESAETAAETTAESAAAESAKVTTHHHEVTSAESAEVLLADLATLGECKECGINILGNEVLCGLACG